MSSTYLITHVYDLFEPFLRRLLIAPQEILSAKFHVRHDDRAEKSSCKLCRIVFYYQKGLLIFVHSVLAFCSRQDRLNQAGCADKLFSCKF